MFSPPLDLRDESACYVFLVKLVHPNGLKCPKCGMAEPSVHRSARKPVLDYRCCWCNRVFNAWTETPFQGTPRRPPELLQIVQGILEGVATARLARDLGCSRRH